MPGTGVESSRPTVAVDGSDAPSLTGGLLRMRVREDVDGLSDCELEVGNWGPNGRDASGFLFFDRRLLDFGKPLKVSVGGEPLFDGRITALEARYPQGNTPSLVVLAEDRCQDLRMTRRTRTFADVSDADVVRQIAGEHGLSEDVDITGPQHRVLAQLNQSDLAFLRDRARALDAEITVAGTKLKVRSRRSASPAATLTYGKELREFRVVADLAGQATSVQVSGWDVAAKEAISETAEAAVVSGELDGRESGPAVLEAAFGARKDALVNGVPQTGDEARARAEAWLKRRARRFLVGEGTTETKPGLRVGATARLAGLGGLFDGDFYVAAVTHRFDGAKGLRTEVVVERPGLGRAA